MNCYLCQSPDFTTRMGEVRDAPGMQIVECANCGLVTLSAMDHIVPGFYENSGMHGDEPTPMDAWLKETEWDDQRRFDMVKAMLPNQRLLDFMDTPELASAYANTLAALGKTDTLIAHLEHCE